MGFLFLHKRRLCILSLFLKIFPKKNLVVINFVHSFAVYYYTNTLLLDNGNN